MIEINIRLEEENRILEAFAVESSEQLREHLVFYLNATVKDFERNIEVSKAIEAYTFVPLTEIVDESAEDSDEPPIEDPSIEEPPIEDPPIE